jgi:restriction system protein
MPIPDFPSITLPILRVLDDGKPRRQSELVNIVSEQFGLTPEERARVLPSGRQAIIGNRVGWARSYMKKAGLVAAPSRGISVITDEGRRVLRTGVERIDVPFLRTIPAFRESWGNDDTDTDTASGVTASEAVQQTPQERLEHSYLQLRRELAQELLERILSASPAFFEQLVVDLLVGMGYGGSATDAGQSIGRSGDDGIDGIIKEDKLGLDVVYIQAKRWQGSVGRPAIQAFAGSLEGHRARKGVFITTSSFTADAREYVNRIEKKIVLVDGALLTQLMIDHDVGVASQRTYTLKRIDADYFDSEL